MCVRERGIIVLREGVKSNEAVSVFALGHSVAGRIRLK